MFTYVIGPARSEYRIYHRLRRGDMIIRTLWSGTELGDCIARLPTHGICMRRSERYALSPGALRLKMRTSRNARSVQGIPDKEDLRNTLVKGIYLWYLRDYSRMTSASMYLCPSCCGSTGMFGAWSNHIALAIAVNQ